MATTTAPIIPSWTLADRLVKARQYAGFTQDELAAEMGAGIKTITRYENGRAARRPMLVAWAHACGVDVEWLISGAGDPDNLTCFLSPPGRGQLSLPLAA